MSKRLFSNLSKPIGDLGLVPWWKRISLKEWLLLVIATLSTLAFVFGLFAGETIFLMPLKSGGTIEASYEDSPVLFIVLMIGNAAFSTALWGIFVAWVRARQA